MSTQHLPPHSLYLSCELLLVHMIKGWILMSYFCFMALPQGRHLTLGLRIGKERKRETAVTFQVAGGGTYNVYKFQQLDFSICAWKSK